MKTMNVDDGRYGVLEAASDRDGRPVQELEAEAIVSWLADAAMDEADPETIEATRGGPAGRRGVRGILRGASSGLRPVGDAVSG